MRLRQSCNCCREELFMRHAHARQSLPVTLSIMIKYFLSLFAGIFALIIISIDRKETSLGLWVILLSQFIIETLCTFVIVRLSESRNNHRVLKQWGIYKKYVVALTFTFSLALMMNLSCNWFSKLSSLANCIWGVSQNKDVPCLTSVTSSTNMFCTKFTD